MEIGERHWNGLGMRIEVLSSDRERLAAATHAVEQVLAEVDQVLSRFRTDSELAHVNARAGRPTVVSPLFGQVLGSSLDGARLTSGAVDPTIGSAIRRLGYDRDFSLLEPGRPIVLVCEPVPGWCAIDYDRRSRRLRLPAGVELDLGAVGKAVAVDLAAAAAHREAGCGVLVGIGGDLACAGPAPRDGWQVLACEDSRSGPAGEGQAVAVHGGALATSSIAVRRWRRGQHQLHHLIDPATSLPVDGLIRTASVAGTSCVEANVAATWAVLRGPETVSWLRQHRIPSRLVRRDGSTLYLGGWPAPEGARAA